MVLYHEGSAAILQGKSAFLNPKMSILRDISVSMVNAIGSEGKSLLDSTAATGIRGIRYAMECGLEDITLIDINEKAVTSIKSNLKRNKVRAKVFGKSIQELAGSGAGPFDVIDLDPFGSPVPNIHDLLKMSHDGTLLMVTATDTAVLCGAHMSACIKLYNARPMHNELCKEAGIRILLGFAAKSAAQFNLGIEPLLSISDMHYMRIFMILRKGAERAVTSVNQLGYAGSCGTCHAFSTSTGVVPRLTGRCSNCGSDEDLAGPLWLGRLYDKSKVSKAITFAGAMPEAKAILERLHKELDIPFFYSIPKMTKSMGIGSVSSLRVIESINKSGYPATPTQFEKDAVKTTAPLSAVGKTVMQCYH